jgi:hypothetical protein
MGDPLRILEVDFKEILRVPGSNDEELLALVTPYLVPDVDEPEWDTEKFGDAPIATPLEALQQIFSGEVPDVEWGGGPYYEAISTLYMHFATSGDEIEMSVDDLVAVEEALVAAGAQSPLSLWELVHRGVPFRVPEHDESPWLGYLTPEEVVTASRLYDALSLDNVPEYPRETIEMLGLLLKDAASRNHALVGVFL